MGCGVGFKGGGRDKDKRGRGERVVVETMGVGIGGGRLASRPYQMGGGVGDGFPLSWEQGRGRGTPFHPDTAAVGSCFRRNDEVKGGNGEGGEQE